MSEIKKIQNSLSNLHITKDESNIDTEKIEFISMDIDQINSFLDSFIEYCDENNIEWERFDYTVYDYTYYKKLFPKFEDEIINLMVKCNEKKIYNNNPPSKKEKRIITEEDLILRFN